MLNTVNRVHTEGLNYLGTRLAAILEEISKNGTTPALKAEFEKLLKNCSAYAESTFESARLAGILRRDTKYRTLLGLPIDIVVENPDLHVSTLDKAVETIDFAISTQNIPKSRALRLMCDELKDTLYINQHLLFVDLLSIHITPVWHAEFNATGMVNFLKRFPSKEENQEVIIQNSSNLRVETNTTDLYRNLLDGAVEEVRRERERVHLYIDKDEYSNPDGDWVAIDKLPFESWSIPVVVTQPPVDGVTLPVVNPIDGCRVASGVEELIHQLYRCGTGYIPPVIYLQPGNEAEWEIAKDTMYAFKYLTLLASKYPGVIANAVKELEDAHKAETSDTDMARVRVCRDLAYQFLYEIDMGMVKRNGKLDHVTVLNDFDFNMYVREYVPMLVPALVDLYGADIIYRIFPEVITPENPGFGETTSHVTQVQIEIASALLQILAEK